MSPPERSAGRIILGKEVHGLKALGRHLILEFYGCTPEALDHKEKIEEILVSAAENAGAHVIHPFFHKFSPQGVSGMVIIAESHLSIHTWPEYGYAAVDVFVCGDYVDCDLAYETIRSALEAKSSQIMEFKRGALDIPREELRHK